MQGAVARTPPETLVWLVGGMDVGAFAALRTGYGRGDVWALGLLAAELLVGHDEDALGELTVDRDDEILAQPLSHAQRDRWRDQVVAADGELLPRAAPTCAGPVGAPLRTLAASFLDLDPAERPTAAACDRRASSG